MHHVPQKFGGSWTEEKLERIRKYLAAYSTILNKKPFKYAYIDAFAGTGYRVQRKNNSSLAKIFPEFFEDESREFLDGSARIALQVTPRFDKYIFVERDKKRIAELERLKVEFPELSSRIQIEHKEANTYLQNLCNRDWRHRRAVLFLDPFGMQVMWETIAAIAKTEAIDLWLLFPVSAVNRLLTRTGEISPSWRRTLDQMFGETGWYDVFYKTRQYTDLFGTNQIDTRKLADFDLIGQYFVRRLRTVFAGVAEDPYPLFNSRNSPLFLLCFAAANPKGAETAMHIAKDILKRK